MIISIASGKGGTGKTFVSTNLCAAICHNVQLMDCDVEEPNAHLFLRPAFHETEKVIEPIPQVDADKCIHCGKCMEICRFSAIALVGKSVITFPELCHSCGGCMAVCPAQAITEKERVLGIVEKGVVTRDVLNGSAPDNIREDSIKFLHGLMDIGQVMAPPIIKQVRSHANPDRLTIIDAPPGTSCPVITAMKDTDFVVLVTEPTPFGLHDLILAVEAVRTLAIPFGIVINRAGLGDDKVTEYAQKENIPILMEIPFDKQIARMYSKGELVSAHLPGYREKFLGLYETIKTLAGQKKEAL